MLFWHVPAPNEALLVIVITPCPHPLVYFP
jgi:hypothetical protein